MSGAESSRCSAVACVGEKENWQVIPFFKGVSGSGNSTACKVLHSFYDPTDVAVLSTNMEKKKFGLSSIPKKLLFLCFEIKKDMCLTYPTSRA